MPPWKGADHEAVPAAGGDSLPQSSAEDLADRRTVGEVPDDGEDTGPTANGQQRQEAVAVSEFDLPDSAHPLDHGCEDCACAVSPASALGSLTGGLRGGDLLPSDGRWVRARDAAEFAVDADYFGIFNTAADGGVVVLNDQARQVLRCFDSPATLADVQAGLPLSSAEVDAVVGRLRQAGVIHPPGQPSRPSFRESTMLTAWLHVSNACNLRCSYCYVRKSATGMDERTGRASVDAVLDTAAAHGFTAVKLKYAGGEASLNSALVLSLDSYARQRAAELGLDLHATLLSNGVALPKAFTQALAAAGVRIMVSLDGVGATHDAQRPTIAGKPSFRSVARTVARLLEEGWPPHLSITITSRSAPTVVDAVRFALDRDLTFSLNFFRDNDCASGFTGLAYTDDEMISGLLAAFALIEERLPPWSVLGSILDRGQLLEPRQRPCGVGQDYVVIGPEGGVAKCHMEIERTLGDVFHDDPLELVRRDTRTTLNLLVEEKEGCRDCTWRHWCAGGCAVATFRATGRYDIKSPNCAIYKAIYPPALRLEALRLLKYAPTSAAACHQLPH